MNPLPRLPSMPGIPTRDSRLIARSSKDILKARRPATRCSRLPTFNVRRQKRWDATAHLAIRIARSGTRSVEGSIAASEEAIRKYPENASLALGLQTLLQCQRMLLSADLKKAPDVDTYFQSLADSAPSPNARSKILFFWPTMSGTGQGSRSADHGRRLQARIPVFAARYGLLWPGAS